MGNYKIKRNPKPLSDEQISRHKDFGKLLNNQQKLYRFKDGSKPLYRNTGFLCMLDQPETSPSEIAKDTADVAMADSGLELPVHPEKLLEPVLPVTEEPGKKEAQTGAIAEEIRTYEIFKVDPGRGAVLYTASGRRLLIPPHAFLEGSGRTVQKEVLVKYREPAAFKETGIKNMPVFPVRHWVELQAHEPLSGALLVLTKPVVLELVSSIGVKEGSAYRYTGETWVPEGKEAVSYRFMIQANESQYPELYMLTRLVWEFPAEGNNVPDFNYIFNRTWRSFSYRTADRKELSVKNTNTSFKGIPEIVSLMGDAEEDQKIKNAFYVVYEAAKASGKNRNVPNEDQAKEEVDRWLRSAEGKKYREWYTGAAGESQLYVSNRISKIPLSSTGVHALSYTTEASAKLDKTKRILKLEQYPEKTQQYINEGEF